MGNGQNEENEKISRKGTKIRDPLICTFSNPIEILNQTP